MAVWSLRPTTCPPSLSLSPLQSSSGFTTSNFRHVSFSTIAYPTLSVKYSSYHAHINIVDDDEPEDELIDRFRKEVIKAGVFQECRRRRFFETPQDKIKRKAREASKRNRKRRPYIPAPNKYEYDYPNKKKDDDGEEEDNWELVDVDVPYS